MRNLKSKKKLYYKIELRLGNFESGIDYEDDPSQKFYYSDGYIVLEGNSFTGFLTKDLIVGSIDKNIMLIELSDLDGNHYTFYDEMEDLILLPERYILLGKGANSLKVLLADLGFNIGNPKQEIFWADINFIESVEDRKEQQEIENELKDTKDFYQYE